MVDDFSNIICDFMTPYCKSTHNSNFMIQLRNKNTMLINLTLTNLINLGLMIILSICIRITNQHLQYLTTANHCVTTCKTAI